MTGAECHRHRLFRRAAVPGHSGPERNAPLDGRRRETRQHRRVLGPRIRGTPLLCCRRQTTPLQKPPDATHGHGDNRGDVLTRQAASRVKDETRPSSLEHTIDDQRVKVHVQVQRTTKALNHHDRSAPSVGHAGPSRRGAQEAEHGSHVHARHRAAQVVVPREHVP